jgi:hypothetical protein
LLTVVQKSLQTPYDPPYSPWPSARSLR